MPATRVEQRLEALQILAQPLAEVVELTALLLVVYALANRRQFPVGHQLQLFTGGNGRFGVGPGRLVVGRQGIDQRFQALVGVTGPIGRSGGVRHRESPGGGVAREGIRPGAWPRRPSRRHSGSAGYPPAYGRWT